MRSQGFGDDIADHHARIERGERVLENDSHVLTLFPQGRAFQREDIDTRQAHTARRRFQQAQNRTSCSALSAAALAHQADSLAAADRKVNTIHGANDLPYRPQTFPSIHTKLLDEASYLEEGRR